MAISTGSKRERRPGVWELRVYAGKSGGKKRWISRTVHGTEAQADAELLRLRVWILDNPPAPEDPDPDIDDPTVAEMLEQWHAARSDDWTPTQPGIARGHIDHHIAPHLGHMRVTELRTRHIDAWVQKLRQTTSPRTGRPYAPSYIARIHVTLHAALERAVRHEIILRNPADDTELPTVRRTERTIPDYPLLVQAIDAAIVPAVVERIGEQLAADRITVSVPEAARMLGLGQSTVWNLINRGVIETLDIGVDRTLIPVASLRSLPTKREQPAGSIENDAAA